MIRTLLQSSSKSPVLGAILIAGMLASSPNVLEAADGNLDPTFGNEGKVRTDFLGQSNDVAFGVATQPDGKIVAAGVSVLSSVQFALARYNADGSLDATFGDGGRALTSFRGWDYGAAVALQGDGKIVVAGTSLSPDGWTPTTLAVARYNPDGSLDGTFGDGGKVLTAFPDGYTEGRALAIQADGKIVVVGMSIGATGMTDYISIARYTVDGALDPSFGTGGLVSASVDENDDPRAITVTPDGRIVVAGSTRGVMDFTTDLTVVRFRDDGSLDPSFGVGGIVRTDATGQSEAAASVLIQGDGKIVVAGHTEGDKFAGWADVILARYDQDGSLDPAFGTAGIVVADLGWVWDEVAAAALQADGRILVGGTSGGSVTVSRYNTDGSADVTFGANGIAQTDFSTPDEHTFDALLSLSIQPDGNIVGAGVTSHFFTTGDGDFALLRFEASASAPPPPH